MTLIIKPEPACPVNTLDRCAWQLDMLIDLLGGAAPHDLELSETGLVGLCDYLRAIADGINWCAEQQRVKEQKAA